MSERKLIGIGNHVFDSDDIASLEVHAFEPEDKRMSEFISIGDESSSILIHSFDQWKQIDILIRKQFDMWSE